MNLREEIEKEFLGFLVTDDEVVEIEQLIKREQIGFAEWIEENYYYDGGCGLYFSITNSKDAFTLDQLLEIYNKINN